MKVKNQEKKNVNVKTEVIEKKETTSSCCGPTCCGNSNKKVKEK